MLHRTVFLLLICATMILAMETQVYMCFVNNVCESTFQRADINISGEKSLVISYDLDESIQGFNFPTESYNVIAISANEIKVEDVGVNITLHNGIIAIKNANEDFIMLYVPIATDVNTIQQYSFKL